MITILSSKKMGKSERGWLHSTFHFSFAEYFSPQHMNYGALRVVNDDIFDAQSGFDIHPHQDMEIISYVIDGVLTHQDSMGNRQNLTRGQVQYMSAGTGVLHSEHNFTDQSLRFLQIWILPDKNGHTPQYGDYPYAWQDRQNKWLRIASRNCEQAEIVLHQDVEISVVSLDEHETISYTARPNRMLYLIQIEGNGSVNNHELIEKDAAKITEDEITIYAHTPSHYILFDLKRSNEE